MERQIIGTLYISSFFMVFAAWMFQLLDLYWLPSKLKDNVSMILGIGGFLINIGCILRIVL